MPRTRPSSGAQVEAVDGPAGGAPEEGAVHHEADPQAVDLEEGHHELLVLRRGRADEGLQGVAAAVDDQDDGQQRQAGRDAEPPGARGQIAHRLRQDDADGRQLAGDAEAEEGQAGLVQDRVREHEHRAHQGLRHDVGREVRPGDEPSAAPHLTRGDDVRAGPQVDRLGAHDAGEGDPVGRRDADHDAGDAAPDEDREEGHEDEVGHALHEVDEPQDDPVDPAAADGGAAPQQQGDESGDQRGGQADADRDRQALERAHEHVAAHPVGAERAGGRGGPVGQVERVRAGRIMWWIRSPRPESAIVTPAPVDRPIGNQPSRTANSRSMSRPNQKVGSAAKT